PTRLVALSPGGAEALAARLRAAAVPIIGRIQDDRLLLDPRTVLPGQAEQLLAAVARAAAAAAHTHTRTRREHADS
ncbi:MAG: hypothetical protein K1X50_03800, partial [Candidatus Promineofilum sp.]|nr:hypothetical protein [Promineifilum sp.]